jgi:hypothetical protein
MPITMSKDNRDAVLNMILVAATRQRDIPKFEEWVLSLAKQVVFNKSRPAVAGPIAIDDYMSGNMVDFNSDPYWGSGTIFTINGSARNDGLFTIASKVNKTSIGNVEFATNMSRVTFTIDPGWTVGMNFTVAGSAHNNNTYTITAVIRNGVYTVSGAAVADEVADSATATNGGFLYQVIEAIDTTNLSTPFVVSDFTTPNVIELDNSVPDPDWLAGATVVVSGSNFFAGMAYNAISAVTPDHVEFAFAPNPVLMPGFQFTGSEGAWTTPVINWRTGNTIQVNTLYIDLPTGYTFDVVGEDRSETVAFYRKGVISTVVSGAAKGDGYEVGDVLTITQAGAALGTVTVTGIVTTDATTVSFSAPSTVTFAVDPAIAHPLCWAPGKTFRIVAAADPANNQIFTIASNVGTAYVVTAVNITTNGADAVAAVPAAGAVAIVALLAGGTGYSAANALATVVGGGSGNNAATVNITLVRSEVEFSADPVWAAGTIFITHDSTTAGNDQTYTVVSNVGPIYTVTPAVNTTEAGGVSTAGDITLDQTYTVVSNVVAGRIVVTPAFSVGAILAGQGGDASQVAVSDVFTVVGNVGAVYEVTPDPALTLPNSGHVAANRDGSFVIASHVPGSFVYALAAAAWSTQGAPAATRVLTGANGVASSNIASMSTPGGDWFASKFLNWFRQGDFSTGMINETRHYYEEEFWTGSVLYFLSAGVILVDHKLNIDDGHVVEIEGSTSNDGTYVIGTPWSVPGTPGDFQAPVAGNVTFTAPHTIVFQNDPDLSSWEQWWLPGMAFTISGSIGGVKDGTYTINTHVANSGTFVVIEDIGNSAIESATATSTAWGYALMHIDGPVVPIIDFRAANVIRFAQNPNIDVDSIIAVHGSMTNDGSYTVHSITAVVATFAAADNSITFSAALDPHTVNPTIWVPGAVIEVSGTTNNNFPFIIHSYDAATHKFIVTGHSAVNEASATAVLKCGNTYAHTDYIMHEAVAIESAPISCYGQEIYSIHIASFTAPGTIEFDFDPHLPAGSTVRVSGATTVGNNTLWDVVGNVGVNYAVTSSWSAISTEAGLVDTFGFKQVFMEVGVGNIRSY